MTDFVEGPFTDEVMSIVEKVLYNRSMTAPIPRTVSLTAEAREIARRIAREEFAGDLPGHPFRGNQYKDGGSKLDIKTGDRVTIRGDHPNAGRVGTLLSMDRMYGDTTQSVRHDNGEVSHGVLSVEKPVNQKFDEGAFNKIHDHTSSMRAAVDAGGPHHVAGDMSNPRVVANANVNLAASRIADAAPKAAFGDHMGAAKALHEGSRILDEAESQARRGGTKEDHEHGEAIRQMRSKTDEMLSDHLNAAHGS